MQTRDALGIGLIGAGSMARAYAECLARYTRGGRLVAVTGGKRAPQLAADFGVISLPDVAALVARSDIHAVVIATPETLHREQTLLAAAVGRHVLVEKPMAPDVAACDEMIAACARASVQ